VTQAITCSLFDKARCLELDLLTVIRATRSLKRSAFQPLHPDGETVAVPIDQLDLIATAIDEEEQIAQAQISLEFGLNDREQSVVAFSQVNVLRVEEDAKLRVGQGG
jgi:hypothetical protein